MGTIWIPWVVSAAGIALLYSFGRRNRQEGYRPQRQRLRAEPTPGQWLRDGLGPKGLLNEGMEWIAALHLAMIPQEPLTPVKASVARPYDQEAVTQQLHGLADAIARETVREAMASTRETVERR